VYVLLITGSEQRIEMITTIITETERDIRIIHEDLVELGDGLPELSSGSSTLCLSNLVLNIQYSSTLYAGALYLSHNRYWPFLVNRVLYMCFI